MIMHDETNIDVTLEYYINDDNNNNDNNKKKINNTAYQIQEQIILMITIIIIILFRLLAENPSLLNLFPKYEHLNTEKDRNNDEAFQV